MAVGPGVPSDRVAALRKAFDDTMKDPAFLADAKKRSLDIEVHDRKHAHALVNKIVTASPDLVTRVKKSIGVDEWIVYLMTEGQDETLEAYGEIISAVRA